MSIPYTGPGFEDLVTEDPTEGIWYDLSQAIEKQVTKDGIKASEIEPGELEEDVVADAVDQIFHDVSEFYYWYFTPDDVRNQFMASQKKIAVIPALAAVIKPVVEDNLAAMRENDEIPAGLDSDILEQTVTDNLVRYILNWQDWYYDRKQDEAIESYYMIKGYNDAIYVDGDYGDYTNLSSQEYDGFSDVPYIGTDSNELS